jgi:predicted O-linked N-acetylglucosamine transferase (SPINDLY family)
MPTMDYFLSSEMMEPPGAASHYTEHLVRLPGLSIHYDEHRATLPQAEARARFGVRPDSVVFWCGQSLFKFLPQHDHIFPRIARAVRDSQFLFIRFRHGEHATALFEGRLAAAFAAHGLRSEDHCIMLPYMDRSDFVASFAASDIFLDSIGWSGCNTTLESLSHDLPIVTLAGDFMRGRHGLAILQQLRVPELACDNVDEYCATAVRLARDPGFRETMRCRINHARHRLYRDPAPVAALNDFLEHAVRTKAGLPMALQKVAGPGPDATERTRAATAWHSPTGHTAADIALVDG